MHARWALCMFWAVFNHTYIYIYTCIYIYKYLWVQADLFSTAVCRADFGSHDGVFSAASFQRAESVAADSKRGLAAGRAALTRPMPSIGFWAAGHVDLALCVASLSVVRALA